MNVRNLIILMVFLLGLQVGLLLGRPVAPVEAQSLESATVREMQRQTDIFRSMDRRLEALTREISRQKR